MSDITGDETCDNGRWRRRRHRWRRYATLDVKVHPLDKVVQTRHVTLRCAGCGDTRRRVEYPTARRRLAHQR